MLKLIIRILLQTLVILYIFPLLGGISFHGNFYVACALAIFFCVLLASIEMIATFVCAIWTISTFGLALLILIPLRILFFWFLPTASLILMSFLLPSILTISNWFSAAAVALMFLMIGLVTRDHKN